MSILDKLKLSKQGMDRQKEFVLWVAKFGTVFAVFLFFFVPIQSRLSSHSSEHASLKKQIQDLKNITTSLLTPEELARVKERVDRFEEGLGDESKMSLIIDQVSKLAEEHHLRMIQIYSDSPTLVKNEAGQELEAGGRKLHVLPVNFRVESDYKNLGNFLKAMADNPSWTFTVESLQLQKPENEAEGLQCDVTLGFITR